MILWQLINAFIAKLMPNGKKELTRKWIFFILLLLIVIQTRINYNQTNHLQGESDSTLVLIHEMRGYMKSQDMFNKYLSIRNDSEHVGFRSNIDSIKNFLTSLDTSWQRSSRSLKRR